MSVLPTVLSNLMQSAAPGVDAAPTAPTQLASAQFNAVMQSSPTQGASEAASAAALPDAASAAVQGPLNLGSQILGNLQRSSSELTGRWQDISARLDQASATPSVTELLQVQTQLLQVSVHYELVGKAISKSTQNIDTMVRMQ